MADKQGHDYDFVNKPPDSLKCLICLLVAREPQQHGDCGKLFCKSCSGKWQAEKNDCPYCREPLAGSIFNDFKTIRLVRLTTNHCSGDQEVKSLEIFCKKKCGWEGELRSVDTHTRNDCPNTELPCPKDCGETVLRKNLKLHQDKECPRRISTCSECKEKIEYRLLDGHQQNKCLKRQYTCPHCQKTGVYDELTSTHLEVCPKVKIPCRKCSVKVFHCDTATHRRDCQYEPVQCKYYHIGCGETPLRKDLQAHEEDAQLHLAMATERVLKLTNLLVVNKILTFKVTDFENKKSSNDIILSPRFRTSPSGYMMCLRIYANGCGNGKGTHVSVYIHLMKGDNDDSLSWPFTGTVTLELLNQLEDDLHHKKKTTFPAEEKGSQRVVGGHDRAPNGRGWPKFISHDELNPLNGNQLIIFNFQYLKNDTLVFRVSAEAPDYKPWLECTN